MEKSKETVDEIVDKGKGMATSVGDVPSVMKEAVETGKEKGLETAVRQMVISHFLLPSFHLFLFTCFTKNEWLAFLFIIHA